MLTLGLAFGLALGPSAAKADDAALCDRAAEAAAAETGVPLSLLYAVARAESGRAASGDPSADARPWPWTIQHGGSGEWLADRATALARARDLVAAGESNIDLGCFQINLHWHGAAFASLDAMLDPLENARYAAFHLAELHARSGDWRVATGAYHSGDPERAGGYAERVRAAHDRRVATAGPAPAAPAGDADPAPAAPVRFGLQGAAGAILTAARGPLIGGP